ncbi:MAG: DUF3854 domain-containing protein [Acidobacteria bacterium]|nr:DUF3854 domain-containing protein [Acidobacteriota bacterium]
MSYTESQRAPADIINGVLSRLICRELSLRPEHRAALLARGLSTVEIERKHYVSAPTNRGEYRRVADSLSLLLEASGGGIPGFYRNHGCWEMVWRPPGYFLAVRDEHGFVQALLQRVDRPLDGGKYIWLSSAERDGGASSGAPPHFAGKTLLQSAQEATITEGALKAEVASYLSDAPVIGVAGTHSIRGLAPRLKTNFPKLRHVFVAYDRDMYEKPQVLGALYKLVAQFQACGFRVRVRTWPGPEKGYDDYLLAHLGGGRTQVA